MERELWRILSSQVTAVDRHFPCGGYRHSVGRIVRVYIWAVLNDRPVCWACQRSNWRGMRPPNELPDQSRMSRRLRQADTAEFLDRLIERLMVGRQDELVKLLDGKALLVARHSQDPDATFGYGAGGLSKGYKLHAIYGYSGRLLVHQVHPMHVSEPTVAREMVQHLSGEGYLLADTNYDRNPLYAAANANGHQLVAPRKKRHTSLGHRRHSPQRIRSIEMVEGPSIFGRKLFQMRRGIETRFGNLSSFGGGLTCLPPWVRRLHRVRLYVNAKLLIRAAKNAIIRTTAA